MYFDTIKNEYSIENILAIVFIPFVLMTLCIGISLIISKFFYLKGIEDNTVNFSGLSLNDSEQQNFEINIF
ncbi:Hypothetical protein SRAE_2000529100 [Strongyloides ratti]|uniref:Uncharacterized protein n=1 Tax=Strongyloides ratti TaxID=34506 RepID=A0A090LLR8_STRRB|nr:Hypothetical protein SRAE_2000529100 [Strongyloides ratti]CEF70666.1 Hypothetical protein SRAE_2000529100 [Strongyloides ratti]